MLLKKPAALIGILVMVVALFLISYKMSAKIVSDKIKEEETSSSEAVSVTENENASSEPAGEGDTSEAPSGENTEADTTEGAADTTDAPETSSDDVLPDPTVINMPADSEWCVVLLNKYYKMNDTYEPLVELVLEDSGIYLDERVAEKFREMYSAALNDGVTLTPCAGYVSPERQERKFQKQVDLYVAGGMTEEEAKAKTAFTVLPAGCSESNYGLAVDIGWLSSDFADSPAYAWLRRNAAAYGFIERYTSDKTDVTHFTAQPWHWRYVGTDAAQYMNEQDICLEEYLGKVN